MEVDLGFVGDNGAFHNPQRKNELWGLTRRGALRWFLPFFVLGRAEGVNGSVVDDTPESEVSGVEGKI